MAARSITETQILQIEHCSSCHVMFGFPVELMNRARQDPNVPFYCPNGHNLHYPGDSPEKRARLAQERADRLERAVASRDEDLRIERVGHAATKGQLTKARKQVARAENGVCPYCTRHFADLERHMGSKHADQPH